MKNDITGDVIRNSKHNPSQDNWNKVFGKPCPSCHIGKLRFIEEKWLCLECGFEEKPVDING